MAALTYDSVKDAMRTFDLLLFKGSDLVSKAILEIETHQTHGEAQFSHAGTCVQGVHLMPCVRESERTWLKEDGVYLFESTMSGKLSDGVPDVEGRSGLRVQLRDMRAVVAAYKGKVAWCPLKVEVRPDAESTPAATRAAYEKYIGLPYDASVVDMAAVALGPVRWLRDCSLFRCARDRLCCSRLCCRCCCKADNASTSQWQFCSELVCNVYRDVGIVSTKVNPQDVMPVDFVPKPGGRETFDADGQVPVLFRDVVYIHA